MTHPERPIVLVGRRRAAIRTARRLDLPARVVDPAADPDTQVGAAGGAPLAVVACTEAAVLPAARLRAHFGLPGLQPAPALRCSDKLAMKRAVRAAGIPCADFRPVSGRLDPDALIDALGLPLVLKSRVGSGSRGTQLIRTAAAVPPSVAVPCLAESFVDGTEMSIESFVVDGAPAFVNLTEYVEPGWANLLPAPSAGLPVAGLLQLNRRAIAALGVARGMTHMEVFLTAGGAVFGELAARPPGGCIMALLELAWGFDPWAVLLAIEAGRPVKLPERPARVAGARFIHPGPGVVRAIHGLDTVRALPSARAVECRLAPGDVVAARAGTGQHRGFAICAGNESAVRRDLAAIRAALRIEMDEPAA